MSSTSAAVSGLFIGASPEFLLAAACCVPSPKTRTARLDEILAGPIHWPTFLAQVDRHRIPGLAHRALGNHAAVPAKIRATLAQNAQANAFANLRSLAFLGRIATDLRTEGIRFAVLKGLPLSQLVFGDIALRHSRDIDLLVAPADTDRTEAALFRLGLQRTSPSAELLPVQLEQWKRTRKHFEYAHPASRLAIELHWRTEHNRFLAPAPDPLAQLEEVHFAGNISIPALPAAQLLPHLCAHGAGHAWFRLKWLADVAALLALEASPDRSCLLAATPGLERPIQQALLLCSALLDVPSTGFTPNRITLGLAEIAAAAMQQPIPPGTHEFVPRRLLASLFALNPSPRYKFEELRIHLASPADWEELALPRWAQFTYPLLRLPLWMKRRFAASRT